ncbi:MAG TPA: tRNA lysidine(34) synthetase TilS [Burkholderiales bacterium]|nr:tRNA lysidine(34) synthetase TilS [Burkholderiales bacterium]
MASSRKRPSARTVAVALSGGVDSVVLLHQLRAQGPIAAIHVHHGLSPNADAWAEFCRSLCRQLGVPLRVVRVKVRRAAQGLEAAAREARYAAFSKDKAQVIALAHNLDDQAETVLMNLLRGAGARGASGMAERSRLGSKLLLRPLLGTSRASIEKYAREKKLTWIEDESNADEALTRNFIRRTIGPLLAKKFPKWKESLGRAARHFSRKEIGREELLRQYLRSRGLKAPSEAKLVEMLKQLAAGGARTLIEHDGARLRVYRGKVLLDPAAPAEFSRQEWKGEPLLRLPALGGELRFRKARGEGIALEHKPLSVRVRAGGERLQPDPRRPRRTLKNLFQEAGVPPWQRERLPLLFSGDDLVWVPGLGIDARFQAARGAQGLVPEWRSRPGSD